MAYASWSVVFGEQPSAAKWNILGTNDASFNDGTGLGNTTITASKLNLAPVTSFVTTSESTASTSYTALTTAQAISVTVGVNGLLLITVGCGLVGTGGNLSYISFALSGANTLASADSNGISSNSTTTDGTQYDRSRLLTGLTAGATTVTAQFRVGGGTGTFKNRGLVAIPL